MKKLLLGLICSVFFFSAAQAQVTNFAVGDVCPDFTVTDINGNSYSLYDRTSQGQYVVLDFFFTTCPPCQQTTPVFNELHEKYGCNEGDLFCIAIDNGDTDAQVMTFESTYGGSFSHAPAVSGVEGGGNAVNATIGIQAYPTYALIGPDNKFISTDIWPISSVADFEASFPTGSGITPQACATVAVTPRQDIQALEVFPNPATNQVRVAADFAALGTASIQIFDMMGKEVMNQSWEVAALSRQETQVSLSGITTGMYMVKVQQNGTTIAAERLNIVQ